MGPFFPNDRLVWKNRRRLQNKIPVPSNHSHTAVDRAADDFIAELCIMGTEKWQCRFGKGSIGIFDDVSCCCGLAVFQLQKDYAAILWNSDPLKRKGTLPCIIYKENSRLPISIQYIYIEFVTFPIDNRSRKRYNICGILMNCQFVNPKTTSLLKRKENCHDL